MGSAVTSSRLAEFFSLEGLVVREDLQQDKRQALLNVTQMFDDFGVPYAVTGGVALQLYSVRGDCWAFSNRPCSRCPFSSSKTSARRTVAGNPNSHTRASNHRNATRDDMAAC